MSLGLSHERQQQWQGSVIASVRAMEGDCRTLNVRACTGRLRRASCLGPVGDTSCGRQAAPHRTHKAVSECLGIMTILDYMFRRPEPPKPYKKTCSGAGIKLAVTASRQPSSVQLRTPDALPEDRGLQGTSRGGGGVLFAW